MEVARPTAEAPPRRTAAIHWGDRLWEILKYSLVAVVLFALLLPIYWIFASSLKLERDFFVSPPAFIFEPTLGNYRSHELIHSKAISRASQIVYLSINFERGVVYGRFLVYRADKDWVVQNMDFSERPETIMPWLAFEGEKAPD